MQAPAHFRASLNLFSEGRDHHTRLVSAHGGLNDTAYGLLQIRARVIIQPVNYVLDGQSGKNTSGFVRDKRFYWHGKNRRNPREIRDPGHTFCLKPVLYGVYLHSATPGELYKTFHLWVSSSCLLAGLLKRVCDMSGVGFVFLAHRIFLSVFDLTPLTTDGNYFLGNVVKKRLTTEFHSVGIN
jgi:hypothetical protein